MHSFDGAQARDLAHNADRTSIHSSNQSNKKSPMRDLSYLLVSPELTKDSYNSSKGYGYGSGSKTLRASGYSFTQSPAVASSTGSAAFNRNASNDNHPSLYAPKSYSRDPYDIRVDLTDSFESISEGDKLSAYGTASDTISAFRELQEKVAIIERERKDAIRMRDELKANCVADRQVWVNSVNQKDIQMTSTLLTTKASNDQLRVFKEDLEMKLSCKEDINRSLQRNMHANKTIHAGLEDDISKVRVTITFMEDRNFKLRESLTNSIVLANKAEVQIQELPKAFSDQYNGLIKKIKIVESDIRDAIRKEKKAVAKSKALLKYIDVVYQMNSDLVATLIAREESKERIIQLAGKFTPPRYSWPTRISNPTIQKVLDVVSDAAVASALEQSAERAVNVVNSHIKDIKRSFSNSPNPKVNHYTASNSHISTLRNNERFSINELGGSIRNRNGDASSDSDASDDDSGSDASESDASTDISLSELKRMYDAKERNTKFNEYVKAHFMKKSTLKKKNVNKKKDKRKVTNQARRKSININIIDNGLASKLLDSDYVDGYSRRSSVSAPSSSRHSSSLRRGSQGSSRKDLNLSPGKLLERHAAQALAAATTAYIMKERDSQSSRARSDRSHIRSARVGRGATRGGDATRSSHGNGAFIPASGNYSKEYNLVAKTQADDRARVFRHQAFKSHIM